MQEGIHIKLLLQQHISAKHELKKISCKKCGKEYSDKSNLRRHEKSHDEDKQIGVKNFTCEFCPKRFTTKNNQKYHLDKIHKMNNSTGRVQFNGSSFGVFESIVDPL